MGAVALSHIWRSVPETPGSAETLRFRDKRIPAPSQSGGQVKTCTWTQNILSNL